MCAVYRPSYRRDWIQRAFGIDVADDLLPAIDRKRVDADDDRHHAGDTDNTITRTESSDLANKTGATDATDAAVIADVYPGQSGLIVARSHVRHKWVIGAARFGLIPPWARDDTFSRRTYNARSETVADKPSYRQAWYAGHFAVALVDHFYEPCYETGGAVRWKIQRTDGAPMGIASLWQRWNHPQTGEVIASFTMLTINADRHPVMSRFHKPADEKRTPLVLPETQFAAWLDATVEQAHEIITSESALSGMPDLVCEPAPLVKPSVRSPGTRKVGR